MPKVILNGIEYASGLDQTTYEKIGDEPLETEAQELSGAVNEHEDDISEIKQSLSQLPYELIKVSGSSTNFDRFEVYSNSQFVYINFQTKNATFNENDVLVNLPSSCRPTNTQMLLGWCYALDKAYMLQLKSNGDLCAYGKGTITGRIIGSVLACII